MPRVTYTMQEPNGRKFKVAGTGATLAAATAEATAKVNLTVGTVISATSSDEIAGANLAEAFDGASYSDATLTLQHSVSGVRKTVHLENITNSVGDALTGDIKLDDPLIIAFATAYRDGDGGGGYVPYDGHFVS